MVQAPDSPGPPMIPRSQFGRADRPRRDRGGRRLGEDNHRPRAADKETAAARSESYLTPCHAIVELVKTEADEVRYDRFQIDC